VKPSPAPAVIAGLQSAQKKPFAQIAIKNWSKHILQRDIKDFVNLQGRGILQISPVASIIPKTEMFGFEGLYEVKT
jgi:hypothetical protein